MAVFNEPTQWSHTLGNNADVSTLPDDTSATSGAASLQKLFQIINQTPLEAGGVAPDREDFNALFKFLGDSIFYMQNGGLWSYNSAFDYAVGRIILYTDGNLYKCIQANGASSTVVTPDEISPNIGTDYWARIPSLADVNDFKTGDIKIITSNTVPSGWLLCNGAGISRTTFSNLFAEIGTTYGTGDGSTTFNIPDLRDRYIIGANANALGAYIAEQLPNIQGYVSDVFFAGTTGPFYQHATMTAYKGYIDSSIMQVGRQTFSLAHANSIYVDNGKVYPLSLALNFIIKT